MNLLIIDDEPNILRGLAAGLRSDDYEIHTADDGESALKIVENLDIHILITDIRLPGSYNGIDLVRIFKRNFPDILIIVITAFATVETAVEAMRLGAFDFITKPLDLDLVRHQVRKAVTHHQLVEENHKLKLELSEVGSIEGLIGQSESTNQIIRQIRQVADTEATVMILGESGTGKEVTARAIHRLSRRNQNPFIPINMGALPENLIESELFGHEKGAFTDARKLKAGHFETAANGTVFLDEITETSGKTQISLLRVLEDKTFQRLGSSRYIPFDARVISASNKNIDQLIEKGEFREDLYYRLNIVPIYLPPLRQRQEDIPLLADHFMRTFCKKHGKPEKKLSEKAMARLCSLPWPGNIRELRNLMERLSITIAHEVIQPDDIPAKDRKSDTMHIRSLNEYVEAAERQAIMDALAQSRNHREKTAQLLQISIRSLHYKMNKYGIQ